MLNWRKDERDLSFLQTDNNRNLLGQVMCSSLREEILLVHYKNTIKRTLKGMMGKGKEGKAGQNLFHHDFYDYYMYFCQRENAKWEIYERSSKF